MKASIILPTKDRGPAIAQTLESLLQLDFHSNDWEIVLVDNCSTAENQKQLQQFQADHPDRVRYVREENLGLNNARNCGIDRSQGDILIFLDDDAVVPRYWLANIVKHFDAHANAYALGSKVIAQFTSPPPEWIDKRLGMYISNFDRGEEVHKLFYNEYPRGANMAFRRAAFAKCGYFRDCFDRKGKSLMSYGDIEMCYRVEQAGFDVLYVPDAEVLHLIRGDRLNVAWFQRRFYWQGRSEGLFERIHFGRKHILKTFWSHVEKSRTGDSYEQLHHRGFLTAVLLSFFRQTFN